MYAAPTLWNALDLDIRCFQKKSQDTSLPEVLCKLILIIFMIFLFLQYVSTVIIMYIIISPLNSIFIYIGYWTLIKYYYYYYFSMDMYNVMYE